PPRARRAVRPDEHQLRSLAPPRRARQQTRSKNAARPARAHGDGLLAVAKFARSPIVGDAFRVQDLVRSFGDHLRSERRASPETVRAYLANVGELDAFLVAKLGRAARAGDLDVQNLRSYLASLFGRN